MTGQPTSVYDKTLLYIVFSNEEQNWIRRRSKLTAAARDDWLALSGKAKVKNLVNVLTASA